MSEDTTCYSFMLMVGSDFGIHKLPNFGDRLALIKLKNFSTRVAGQSCKLHVLIFPDLLVDDSTAIGRLKRVEIHRIPYFLPFLALTKGSTLVSKGYDH